MNSEYLEFLEGASATGKTKIVTVLSKRQSITLGHIRWSGQWRQYVFVPQSNTMFSVGCMNDINTVISQLMNERSSKQDDFVDVFSE